MKILTPPSVVGNKTSYIVRSFPISTRVRQCAHMWVKSIKVHKGALLPQHGCGCQLANNSVATLAK
jgi:hypothetical protein